MSRQLSRTEFAGFANCPATVPLGVPAGTARKAQDSAKFPRVSREVSRCPVSTVQLVSRLSRFSRNGTAGQQRGFTGAHCELPTGETVEVHGRRTPFFSLCRKLEKCGYDDCRIQIATPGPGRHRPAYTTGNIWQM